MLEAAEEPSDSPGSLVLLQRYVLELFVRLLEVGQVAGFSKPFREASVAVESRRRLSLASVWSSLSVES